MRKTKQRRGFTLAELLIVVAIIAVLVAVAIPVFSGQLEKARKATGVANLRSAYARAVSAYIAGDTDDNLYEKGVTANEPGGTGKEFTYVARVRIPADLDTDDMETLPFDTAGIVGCGSGDFLVRFDFFNNNMITADMGE